MCALRLLPFFRSFLRNLIPAFIGSVLFGGAAYSVRFSEANVRCRCCASCRAKVNRAGRAKWLVLLVCFGYPLLLCSGILLLVTPGRPENDTIMFAAVVSMPVVWV